MFYYLLSVAMGIRVQFLAEECSELQPVVGSDLGGSTASNGMDVLTSLLRGLLDSLLEKHTNHSLYSEGYQFVPPPPLTEGGDILNIPVLPLLQRLGVRKFLMVISAVLCEWRILFVSSSLQRLSQSAHAAMASLYPLVWQHTFIPILPAKLVDCAVAPTPFIIGIGKSLLGTVQKMPLSSVMIVNLDDIEVFMSDGPYPPLLCPTRRGDSSRATATKKIQKSYGKAINKLKEKFVVDEAPSSHSGNTNNVNNGNNLMDNLCTEVRTVYNRIEERGLMEDRYVGITQEDVDLKKALLTFFVCLLGNSKIFFPNEATVWSTPHEVTEKQQKQQLRFDQAHFIRQREEIGDPPHFLQFLNEFTHSQMLEEHLRMLIDLESEHYANDNENGLRPKLASTFLKCVNSCKAYCRSPLQSFSYITVKNVVASVMYAYEVGADSSSIVEGNSERQQTVGMTNHLMAPLLERGSVDVNHVQVAIRKLSARLLVSREVQGIMSHLWRTLFTGTGSEWRKSARALYVLYELLLQGPDNVVADVLGRVPALFRIVEIRSHRSSDRGHEAVQGLGRRLLQVILDLRQLVWMRRTRRLSQTADSEQKEHHQQQPKEVERFPFHWKKPLDFTALHSLISDVMTDGGRKHDTGSFQEEYVDIMGKPSPPPTPVRPNNQVCTPLKVYSDDDQGIWAEKDEEESSPVYSMHPIVSSDSVSPVSFSYQDDGGSPSENQEQISPSSLPLDSSSSSEEDACVALSFGDVDEGGGLELNAMHEKEEESPVMDGWESLAIDVLKPTAVSPPCLSTLPLVLPIQESHEAEAAFGDGGGQSNDGGGILTPFHPRHQHNVDESSAPSSTTASSSEKILKVTKVTEQFNRQMMVSQPPPPIYNNKPLPEVESSCRQEQNQTSVELDNNGLRLLPLNQQQQMERPALPRTPVERLNNQSSMVSSSSIGMSQQQPPPHQPLSSSMVQMEQQLQLQQQQPYPYSSTSVGMALSQQTPLRMYGGPTAHQTQPYIPPHMVAQQPPGYVYGHAGHHPTGTVPSSPFNVQQEVLRGGDHHSGLTQLQQQQQQNLAMGKMTPTTWQSQNVSSSGMNQEVHQSPICTYPPTALPVQQQQKPYLASTLQQMGQPPPHSASVPPQHECMPSPYVVPPLEQEWQSYPPQMAQQQLQYQNYLAPGPRINQQHQFAPSGFVMPQGQNLGEKQLQPLVSQFQQQPPMGNTTPSMKPASEPLVPQLQQRQQQSPRDNTPSPQTARPKRVRPARPSLPAQF